MYLTLLMLPIIGSIVSGFLGRKIGVTGAHVITCSCLIVSALLAIVAFYEVGLCNSPVSIHLSSWIDSELMDVSWGFMFDSLTVSMEKEMFLVNTSVIAPTIIIGKRWANIYKPKHIGKPTTCTELTIWNSSNSMGSTRGYKASYFIRMFTGIPSYHVGVLVGLLLGDASVTTFSKQHTWCARIIFSQSIIHFPYVWHVYQIIMAFCQSFPGVNYHHLKTGTFISVVFKTRAYHAFSFLYHQFIVNGVKIVPVDIYNLLNEAGLAH